MATVRELIEYLTNIDLDADVLVLKESQEWDGFTYAEWVDLEIPKKGGQSDTIIFGGMRNAVYIGEK